MAPVSARVRRLGRAALALSLAGVAVAACTKPEQRQASCPRPAIVNGLERYESHAGSGADPSSLRYRGTMLGFSGGCGFDGDGALVRLAVDLVASPGPAYDGSAVELPYFVAVAGPDGAVIDKQTFTAQLGALSGGQPKGVTERLEQRIAGVTRETGPGYRIFLGFDVPPEEAMRRREEP